ncbi:MAG TPA: hypothetical protein VM123_02570, partial [archaeon]|nr:hypothetical protein [archaeon]
MAKTGLHRFFNGFTLVLPAVLVVCSFVCSCGQTGKQAAAAPRYKVVAPGTHPGLLFSEEELPGLRRRAKGETLAAEAYRRVLEQANAPEGEGGGPRGGRGDSQGLLARALVCQVEGDKAMGRKAVEQMIRVVRGVDPVQFLQSNYDPLSHGRYPIMLGFAWDWLYPVMEDSERAEILAGIENWCKALFEHTEKQWWRDASYNCGAVPVGALGIACVAIRGESKHPELKKWLDSSIIRVWRNYYPTAWRENGICYEGPCYAQYQMDPTKFGETLRRTGGPDILDHSGAINAMVYQRFQWMPHGGCSPIGDNTEYGRRVFAAPYLLGIGEMADRPGLWTFVNYTDRNRLDPIITFLWYPDDLEPVSPAEANLPTSGYFEITRNRAGYLFARSAWADEQAVAFAFVTRYEDCNHQHYDMNSFLFSAFGREWATHRNIYGYQHPLHGADIEHNLVIVDTGGMPINDRPNSAGDDCSLYG